MGQTQHDVSHLKNSKCHSQRVEGIRTCSVCVKEGKGNNKNGNLLLPNEITIQIAWHGDTFGSKGTSSCEIQR